ncbi:MAG: hypothetical protein FJ096_13340 [Deltaproteobacteria bacterium]|nr:hypothetical protein [Deltaproteobacteria bacterium]
MSAATRAKELIVGPIMGMGLGTWTSFAVAMFLTGVLDPVWMPWRFQASLLLLVVPSMLVGAALGTRAGLRRVRGHGTARVAAEPPRNRSPSAFPVLPFVAASLVLGALSALVLVQGGTQAGRGAAALLAATLIAVAMLSALTGRRLARRARKAGPQGEAMARRHARLAWIPTLATTLGGIGLLRWPPLLVVTLGLPTLLVMAMGSLLPIVWFTRPAR